MISPWLVAVAASCGPAADEAEAHGDQAPESEPSQTEGQHAEPDPAPSPAPSQVQLDRIEVRLGALAADNERLRQDNERLRQDNERLRAEGERIDQRVESLEHQQRASQQRLDGMLPLTGRLGGYLDVGAFWAAGNGSGVRPDTGHVVFPQYDGVLPDSWVLMGDPLSTQVNARGDPADTGDSLAVVFDPIDSGGKSSFIANALNLDVTTGVGDHLFIEGLVDLIPRSRDVSNQDGVFLGDYVDVKLAYLDYLVPTKRFELDLYAGKIDPVFGYEYRVQESPDRISVTPSLACRYTCGRPLGVKARAKFLASRALVLATSVTNGSSFREGFGFSNETDTNHFKTVAGRLSYRFDVGAGLELGASGQIGAQDLQPDDGVYQWQYGFDLHLDVRGVDLAAELVIGRADGATAPGEVECGSAPCLDFKTAYGLLGYRALNWLMPYVRVDWRDALHRHGAGFVYVSELVRVTPGVRFELGTHVAIKAEYTVNRELGPIPQFDNDVLSTSVVAQF
ncbi:cell division protein ZapB [Paraliomyxa miuraensis]|uniref:cell division protein ZapB n=1 Tax=Paraliomyxa miuraensis TaxID=376150 RepID=UPI00225BE35A|nr:cell division protein ZapB [Paraliomyxa miuraensis]MCX4239328.1 cell division protein ZapB [Paraliomyxa miuraensis]